MIISFDLFVEVFELPTELRTLAILFVEKGKIFLFFNALSSTMSLILVVIISSLSKMLV